MKTGFEPATIRDSNHSFGFPHPITYLSSAKAAQAAKAKFDDGSSELVDEAFAGRTIPFPFECAPLAGKEYQQVDIAVPKVYLPRRAASS